MVCRKLLLLLRAPICSILNWLRRRGLRSQQIKKKYGELYTRIEEILFRHDPININYGFNSYEYDNEVETILLRLKRVKNIGDVQNICYKEFRYWFGNLYVCPEKYDDYRIIAEEIWDELEKYRESK